MTRMLTTRRRMPAGGIPGRKKSVALVSSCSLIVAMIALLGVSARLGLAQSDEPAGVVVIENGAAAEQQIAEPAAAAESNPTDAEHEADDRVPVYLSERKLRGSIVNLNEDLRQLKRDFIEDATSIYLRVGQDSRVGRAAAARARIPALAAHLAVEEFGQILIKKHIAERRLLSGLKAAFVKLLPMPSIKRLMAKFASYRWLRGSHHYDLSPRFEGAGQLQFVQIYEMIELRARLRVADDVLTLTSEHIKRILAVVEDFLIENKFSLDTTGRELAAMAELLPQMLQFYLNQVVYARSNIAKAYGEKLACIGDITAMANGEEDFLKLIDELLDTIGLDIELNEVAHSLELPPTINEEILANLERKWIPRKMLDSVKEERQLLLKHRRHVKRLLEFNGDKYDDDLANWIYQMSETIAERSYN